MEERFSHMRWLMVDELTKDIQIKALESGVLNFNNIRDGLMS